MNIQEYGNISNGNTFLPYLFAISVEIVIQIILIQIDLVSIFKVTMYYT